MNQVGHLQKLHEKYFDKGLRIIAISRSLSGMVFAPSGAADLLKSSKSICDLSIGRCPSPFKQEDQRVTLEVPSVRQPGGRAVWRHGIGDHRDDVLDSQRRVREIITARVGDKVVKGR